MLSSLILLLAPLADLRVGEAGGVARVEVVCAGPCEAEPSAQGWLLRGVEDELAYDVSAAGARLTRVGIAPAQGGSRLSFETSRPDRGVTVKRCGRTSLCFDIDLRDAAPVAPDGVAAIEGGIAALEAKGPPRLAEDAPFSLRASLGEDVPDAEACEAAAATVEEDAWALDALRTHALCRGLAGRRQEAATMLARLAGFTGSEEDLRLAALVRNARPALR
jgi:hypothetical protein